ncbi:hypothetical protein [Litchfieldella xinjiangensis]|uniref:hypothetical protein n=1 Tax=Litchfieldella xinjiangensis TaxID=1166948 RepID=UPI0005B9621D|nr:hypothetical protein [Halomonas xinjiangensis]
MSYDTHAFEEALLTSRDEFIERQHRAVEQAQEQFGKRSVAERKTKRPVANHKARPKHQAKPQSYKIGYIIKLAVRKKRIALDDIFEYQSSKISKFEAMLDAERAARDAGYPIIGHVHSVEKL